MMSIGEQTMLGRFLRLSLLRFFGVQGEDAYEILIDSKSKLHNLGRVDTRGMDYPTFQLNLEA